MKKPRSSKTFRKTLREELEQAFRASTRGPGAFRHTEAFVLGWLMQLAEVTDADRDEWLRVELEPDPELPDNHDHDVACCDCLDCENVRRAQASHRCLRLDDAT